MYGNYNFWSWLQYWYLDSQNKVTMLLLDKGYYDYDYKPLSDFKQDDIQGLGEESSEETQKLWSRFTPKKNLKKMSMEQLQRHAINEFENR